MSFIFCALTPPTVPTEHHIQDNMCGSQMRQWLKSELGEKHHIVIHEYDCV